MATTAQVREGGALPPLSARDIVGIFKPRIALSIMLSALGGFAITPGTSPGAGRVTVMALAVFLAAAAAGAMNQWYESDLDARMKRTAGRPFASGRATANASWLTGILAMLACATVMAFVAGNAWVAFYNFMGAFTYAVVYTLWLKRRTVWNIVVGGMAGSFAVLAGAALVSPSLSREALLLAVVLFLWTPPHFWSLAIAARDDYACNGVPMLPVSAGNQRAAWIVLGHTVALSLIALTPALLGMGWVYLVFALAGGGLFTRASVHLVQDPTRKNAIRNFVASLVQLSLLLTGIAADRLLGLGA